MTRLYAYSSIAIAVLVSVVLWTSTPPTQLTERQKRDVVHRLHTEILYGQLLYNLPQLLPPTVQFTLTNGNAAESVCLHTSPADWTMLVNERLAASHWREFLRETIPHEAGHFILCASGNHDWHLHGARWATTVRELGATPKEYHRYAN